MIFYGYTPSQVKERKPIHIMMFRAFILAGLLLCSFMFGAYMDVFANTDVELAEPEEAIVYELSLVHTSQQDVKRTVDVQQGDTLWDIANTYQPSGTNIRTYIEEIKLLNDLDNNAIYVGQLLYLP